MTFLLRLPVMFENLYLSRWGLVLLSFLLAFGAGLASLGWASPFAPLIVGGIVALVTLLIMSLQRPERALHLMIFLFWLPDAPILNFLRPPSDFFNLALFTALLAWGLQLLTRRRAIVWERSTLLIFVLIFWDMISIFWAHDPVLGRKDLVQWMISFVMLFLIVNEIDSLLSLNGMMRVLAVTGWVLILGGILGAFFSNYEFGARLSVWGMNENLYGLILIVTLPGVLWAGMQTSGWKKLFNVVLSAVFILLTITLVLLSGSRGSSMSLVITLAAFAFWKPTRIWAWLGLIGIVVATISAPFLFSTVLNRIFASTETEYGGRPVLWQASLMLIRDRPWSGAGAGNGPIALNSYIRALTDAYGYVNNLPSHNAILEVGVDLGIPGMLLYVGILVSAIWQFIRRYLQLSRADNLVLHPYFALISCTFIGYITSWFKGGGLSNHLSYILFLALLIVPSRLKLEPPST